MFDKKEVRYRLILSIFAVFSFILWRWLGVASGISGYLNIDDLCSVQFAMIGDGITEKISGILAHDPTNVPVFYLILYIWIKLFGYNANIMRILPEICGALFIFVVGLIGKRISNEKMGIIAAIVAGTSIQLIYVSYQVRAYSMLMLFSAIAFYMYLKRTEQCKTIVAYTVSLVLLSYTHFFGVLVCAALGSLDVLNMILKRQKKVHFIAYIIYGCLFFPYLIVAFIKSTDLWAVFWPPVPSYRDIFSMLGSMCPGADTNWSIYIFGCVFFVYLVAMVKAIREKDKKTFVKSEIFTCFWVIFAVLVVGFIYSKYIKPESSVWVYRYFLVLYPFVITIISYGIMCLVNYVEKRAAIHKVIFTGILLFLGCNYTYKNVMYAVDHPEQVAVGGKDYEKLTEYIMEQKDVCDEDTLVYFGYPDRYFDGWKEYASRGGERELPNLYCSKDGFDATDLSAYNTIYVVSIVYELTEEEKAHLAETHQIVSEDCDGVYYVDKYEKYESELKQ